MRASINKFGIIVNPKNQILEKNDRRDRLHPEVKRSASVKCIAKIAVCVVGGLTLNGSLVGQEFSSITNLLPDEPYAPIVARNVFGLNSPPQSDPAVKTPEYLLPRITPNGIMTLFGHPEVIFKTSGGGRPGHPGADVFYDLAEGQVQDEIEVTHIDVKESLVTFKNHNVVQTLPLGGVPDSGTGHFVGAHFRDGFGRPNPT